MSLGTKRIERNRIREWSLLSSKKYIDPFNEIEVSAVFTDPDGEVKMIPAFWKGAGSWGLRYSSPKIGVHTFHTVCSDESNQGLHGLRGKAEVIGHRGKNPLFKHGPLRVSKDGKYLEHLDGTPFFWLGDTWWMGFAKRFRWPDDFKLLTKDRVKKGFSIIQIVAGLYPDMPPFDPRGENEGGFPWDKGYSRINQRYFDFADRRVDWLVENGLVPCIVGAWGYFMKFAGEGVMRRHWRNLIARYFAYPVVWCIAGEVTMPYYLWDEASDLEKRRHYSSEVRAAWTRVTNYVRLIDPNRNPITIHPSGSHFGRDNVDDPSVLDIDMLHTSHSDIQGLPVTVDSVTTAVARSPRIPVVVGEVTYEGIMGASWENIQRLMFWVCMLSGTAGHTYGANGIWQVNTRRKPFGPSPHGRSWVDTPWEDAYRLTGSTQVGLGKKLLQRYQWWRFEPHPEWVEPHWSTQNYQAPYAAGISEQVRVFYMPSPWQTIKVKEMENAIEYRAFYYDPRTGHEYKASIASGDANHEWRPPIGPMLQDLVLVLERS